MKYECYMCLWSTPIKTKMVSHIGRIRPCKNINNINLEDCKEYILNGLSYNEYLNLGINHVNHCKSSVNLGKSSVNLGKSSVNLIKIYILMRYQKKVQIIVLKLKLIIKII